jgi:galactofuranosylgalactofuranosylrhamnosyl-N-acetylglucosaminyl-diphospho-decaprenol beta-1,5/1,6-galactofuranosyltransferase
MRTPLWRFVLPSPHDARPIALYVRRRAAPAAADGSVALGPGDVAEFDTYFNAFSVAKWTRHTSVRDVAVEVTSTGQLRLEVVHDRLDRPPAVVACREVESAGADRCELALPPLGEFADGALFLRATGIGTGGLILDAAWSTGDPPQRDASLGVVITTFNRPHDVRANVANLVAALDASPLADRVEVVVVDNGRNLDLGTDAAHVTRLPNANTGGAGGFARGLAYLRERTATHVLFMDDDVTFDPEIVFRTVRLLDYATDPWLCVAGAMFDRDRPSELFEAGAQFVGTSLNPNRAIGYGLDLEDRRLLLAAEREDERIDYGAWWYFAFPIDVTSDNPLPTFVRGDDVCWGLMHTHGHTITLNGIGLWHDSFERKNGPLAWFYETRNFALASVLTEPRYRWWHLLLRYVNLCGRSLVSLKYASATNITFGMQEFLRGPEHWLALDQEALNERVNAYAEERVIELTPELAAVDDLPVRHGTARFVAALASVVSLGGHLVPASLDREPMRAVPIQHRVLGASPGQRAILYRDDAHAYGFVARRDRRRFFRLFGDMLVTAARIPVTFGRVRRAYRAAYPEMVSDAYWKQQFG